MASKNLIKLGIVAAVLCMLAYFKRSSTHQFIEEAASNEKIKPKAVVLGRHEVTATRQGWLVQGEATECTPARSIVFVKTHKTGGTSVKTVLEKHRDKYLRIDNVHRSSREVKCIPCPYYGGYPGSFKARFANVQASALVRLESKENETKKKVLFGHMRFDKDEVQSIMSPDAKYVTILRNPFNQFQSSFHYFYGRYTDFVTGEIEIACRGEPFLQVAGRFGVTLPEYLRLADRRLSEDMPWFFRSKNCQSYELGLDPKNLDDAYIMQKARELDSAFDLVMITEYFLESLILMKDVLCIGWNEMVGKYRNKGEYPSYLFGTEEVVIMKRLFKQDFVIFEYFNRTFWRKVDEYGRERMERDKQYLLKLMADADQVLLTRGKRNIPKVSEFTEKNYNMTNSREQHIDLMVDRIFNRTFVHKRVLDTNVVRELANYMYDNSGSCPR